MIRSLDPHVSAVTGVVESLSRVFLVPSLWLATMYEPPLPSSTAVASELSLGEKAAALGDAPSRTGPPEARNSTSEPVAPPSGAAVGVAVGVGATAVPDGGDDEAAP